MRNLLLIFCIAFINNIQAADLTIPNTFTAGTPAVSAEVNANFTAVENAVDDNNTNITTNATDIGDNTTAIGANTTAISGKQDRVTGTCGAGSSIRVIDVGGTVTCEPDNNSGGVVVSIGAGGGIQVTGTVTDPTVSQISGAIGIPAVAWHVENEVNCSRVMNVFRVQVNGTNCRISAPVYPPHGATITELTCLVFGNTTGVENIELIGRPSNSTNGLSVIAATPDTDGTPSNQTLSTTAITSPLVNGISTNYYLRSSILDSTGLLQIYNCHVHYSF